MIAAKMNRSLIGGARSRAKGFTLLELMIVVIIIGILASIAWPSYRDYVQRSRRADAKKSLLAAVSRQEQFILDRGTYTTDMEDLGYADDPALSEDGHYSIDAAACAATAITRCYVLTATPVAGGLQADDARCATFSVSSTGERTATGTQSATCW